MEVHKHWAYVLLALVAVWLFVRVSVRGRPEGRQGWTLGLGVLAVGVLLITGYYGGNLVYGNRMGEGQQGQATPVARMIGEEHTGRPSPGEA